MHCGWHLVYIISPQNAASDCCQHNQGDTMSDIASLRFAQPSTLFSRLKISLDRLLLAYAQATIRNGDVPRCGI